MVVSIGITDVLGTHYKTYLEIAVKHLRRGDEVPLLTCRGDLQTCTITPSHNWNTCVVCKSKLRSGLSIDEVSDAKQHVLSLEKYKGEVDIPLFSSISELKDFEIDGVNHGMEAASTVISALRKPKPNMREYRDLVERSLFTAVALYRATLEHIDKVQPSRLYLCNGRRASQMPFVRAAWKKDVDPFAFEVGHDVNKYILVEGTYFHDLDNKKEKIEEYWNKEKSYEKKKKVARKFYRERRYGSGKKFLTAKFKDGQERGKMPEKFDPKKRNIAVFNSSEDEFEAVKGYENPVYSNQIEGIRRILCDPNVSKEIQFYLRVHPNLEGINNYQTKEIEKMEYDNLTIIPAGSDIDSYEIMEKSEKVLTFGSAMSIESAYAGKPSILIGKEPYEELGSCYTPKSHKKAIELLNSPDLPALDKLGALKYGYYMIARDREYEIYDTECESFLGEELKPPYIIRRLNGYIRKLRSERVSSLAYGFIERRLKKLRSLILN